MTVYNMINKLLVVFLSTVSILKVHTNFVYQLWEESGANNMINLHIDPEVNMNATQLITSKGYPCQDFEVHTEDGFILGLQRIPHGLKPRKYDQINLQKPVVFLQHGLLCSSTNWLTNLVNESLAYLLADAGFDVWLGNVRGNTYSRKHEKYKPDQNEFWAWSWDEMAHYDIPAMIDFALKTSGQQNLYYIGHSQGTLILFAQLAKNPDFAKKIKTFYALGPVAVVKHIESPLGILAYYTKEIQDLFYIFGVKEFLPKSEIFKVLGETLCNSFARIICENTLFLLAGYDTQNLNTTRLPVYVSHSPAGTSVQNMVHFTQMVRSGNFQMYDYGSSSRNQNKYGQDTPPLYNFSNIHAPVALFSSQYDWLADPWDVSTLSANLPNIIYQEEIPTWNHLDFIWAPDAPNVIYNNIIKMIKKQDFEG